MATFLLLLLCTSLELACGQQGTGAYVRTFPQWLTGIIAVSVFLFLVLIVFVINRIWCGKSQANELPVMSERKATGNDEVMSNGTEGRYSTIVQFRSKEHENAYENEVEPEAAVITTPM
ncbi:PDZK1-interacting protein 1 [Lissotriton helveticus]